MKTRNQRRNMLRGPAQLALFSREDMLACGDRGTKPRSSHARTVVEEIDGEERPSEGGHQMVALWHDRTWAPLRVFRRGDGATVVVFEVRAA